jgi:hypothetical protein
MDLAATLPREETAAIEDCPLYFFTYNYKSGEVREYVIAIDRGGYFEEIKAPNARTLGDRLNNLLGEPDGGPLYIFSDVPVPFWGERGSLTAIKPNFFAKRHLKGAFSKEVKIKWKRS